jgi:hypothetical protein
MPEEKLGPKCPYVGSHPGLMLEEYFGPKCGNKDLVLD